MNARDDPETLLPSVLARAPLPGLEDALGVEGRFNERISLHRPWAELRLEERTRLAMPVPCSPVMVPPRSMAASVDRGTRRY